MHCFFNKFILYLQTEFTQSNGFQMAYQLIWNLTRRPLKGLFWCTFTFFLGDHIPRQFLRGWGTPAAKELWHYHGHSSIPWKRHHIQGIPTSSAQRRQKHHGRWIQSCGRVPTASVWKCRLHSPSKAVQGYCHFLKEEARTHRSI